ncbi:MAG TPA: peroxidase [Chroococcales cyanobacterium]
MNQYKPEKPGKPDKPGKHDNYDDSDRPGKPGKPDKPGKHDDDDRDDKPGKPGKKPNVITVNLKATQIDPHGPEYQRMLKNLQGNILKGHGREHSVHIFLKFTADTKAVRKWIESFAQKYVTSAEQQLRDTENYKKTKKPGGLFGNFFLSAKGYEALGFTKQEIQSAFVEEDVLFGDKVDVKFTKGMAAAQSELKDPSVASWEQGYRVPIDAVILLADENEQVLHREATAIIQDKKLPATVVAVEYGAALRNEKGDGIEHFGYVDGRSQPLFLNSDIAAENNKDGIDQWNPSAPLELALAPDPFGQEDDCLGSYVVFRKLEQNVRGFKQRERQLAQALGLTEEDAERAGAMVVGRFEDGTPVVLQPNEGLDSPVPNNFTYNSDTQGSKCPFHAHIRKMNPRGDIPNFFGRTEQDKQQLREEELSHRIVRRGIPFGKQVVDPGDDSTINQLPTGGVGLLFMCFQSNIARQFGFLQKSWANNVNFVQPATGVDPVIGHKLPGEPPSPQQWPQQWGQPNKTAFDFGQFVTMKGGEFFFAPSIPFLRQLKKAD